MKKNIWIFNHYAHPPAIPGGTRHYDLAKELVERGHQVTIFASSFLHGKREDLLGPNERYREEMYDGIRFVWIKTTPYFDNGRKRIQNMLHYAVKIYGVSKKFAEPDVIIGSSVHLFTCLSAYYIAKRYKCKYLLEIRDIWPQTLVDMGALNEKSPVARVFYALEKFLYKKADEIIVLLPGASDYIEKLGISEEKIKYVPNGTDLKSFDLRTEGEDPQVTQILQENQGKFISLYAGSMGPANGLDNVVRTAQIIQEKGLDHIQFVFVGGGNEKKNLMALAEDLKLQNIKFYDSINKQSVPLLLTQVDVNIFNLKDVDVFKYGISSNKLFDYMSSGKPVAFACKALNPIVDYAEAGVTVRPEQPEELAEAIIKLYQMDSTERDRLGQNGRKYIEKEHDVPRLVDRLEKLI